MKRIGNLFNDICDIDNLLLADTKARKGKRNTLKTKIKPHMGLFWL